MRAGTLEAPIARELTADIISFLVGIWVIISPLVLSFTEKRRAVWNDAIVGAAIMVITLLHASSGRIRASGIGWINYGLGIWLIISPYVFVIRYRPGVFWNQVVAGIIVAVSSLTECELTTQPPTVL